MVINFFVRMYYRYYDLVFVLPMKICVTKLVTKIGFFFQSYRNVQYCPVGSNTAKIQDEFDFL